MAGTRALRITRKRALTGMLIPYYIVLNQHRDEFFARIEENDVCGVSAIRNGKTLDLRVSTDETLLFVAAFTSTGPAYSEEILLPAGNADLAFLLLTKYDAWSGSSYQLSPVPFV